MLPGEDMGSVRAQIRKRTYYVVVFSFSFTTSKLFFRNPYPGKLFNKPNGEDVYKGVKIDYSGRSVTPQNFLNVLKGNASGIVGGNGRVLQSLYNFWLAVVFPYCSKPNDRIFIFYSDHGGVGTLAFPIGTLTVKMLSEAMNWMYENKRYGQLVFYLEACYSGSMFDVTLSSSINAYAITAAHRNESSWATYCNTGKLPCLGDEFSVNWMEDSDVVRGSFISAYCTLQEIHKY
ncbi:peptidase C13 family protein [Oesophagostomum dentatum]|uniref:Peptidase C13 family protein n=1 Tax=Oesophagostomum dentatum TaxID=61180 RepID=A0A0B1SCW8_OESDE|nr:peptidase C13 family protein [Oesophagostomum dentatum]